MVNIVQVTVKDERYLKSGEFNPLIEKIKEANKNSLYGIELEFVVEKPWGSYIPTKDGFFIPPERKPYEPEYVQVCGRVSRSITDYEELKNAQNKYNILMNEISNKITVEKLELIVEYLTKVISKNLSSKKKTKVFRKIRKIYG